ncbi:MAG: glutamyl-tRNA reductase [Candidatus Omnitrophica bacterium]|nr:glutamyl-tRNA reductase [Candidatus Omnitrophota bacterium]
MPFLLVGVNHKSCPLDTREKFFLQPMEKDLLCAELNNDPRVLAVFVLSTCNRTEIYLDLLSADPDIVFRPFFHVKQLPASGGFEKFFYIRRDQEMVAHLLSVVSGLDSLILGEKQILGQVKEAVRCSQEKKMMNRAFNILANVAIETGKKVRRDTQIDFGGSSVAWAAVTKAEEILGSLDGKSVLVMGAGKMGGLAAQQLKNKGVGKIYVMNRTDEKADELALVCEGEAVPFWKIREVMELVDVCICSTGAPHYLVDMDLVQAVMPLRAARKLALIDIAVPRNIDPLVAAIEGVTLVAVDGLAQAVEENMNKRLKAVEHVERIIRLKINEFYTAVDKALMMESLRASGKEGAA